MNWSGFESPGEWEDLNRIFGVDGPDIQYTVSDLLSKTNGQRIYEMKDLFFPT